MKSYSLQISQPPNKSERTAFSKPLKIPEVKT